MEWKQMQKIRKQTRCEKTKGKKKNTKEKQKQKSEQNKI